MRLLVLTQKIDKSDDVLGFFHGWLEKFAEQFEKINAVCLEKGEYALPSNVYVHSLGKEEGRSRLQYVMRFYRYIFTLRRQYDAVLVHMNQEYVLLGAVVWRLMGKKVVLWYNHPVGGVTTLLAGKLAHSVLYTSPYAYTAKMRNACRMPVGIDTNLFIYNSTIKREPHSILFLGRISPAKRLDVLLKSCVELDREDVEFALTVVGEASERDRTYEARLKQQAEKTLSGKVKFIGAIPNSQISVVYNSHEIYVNLSASGHFDKSMIEAMACETTVLASSKVLREVLPEALRFREGDDSDLTEKLKDLLSNSAENKAVYGKQLRDYVVENHSLNLLSERLAEVFV